MEFDPVTHRDHHIAPSVLEALSLKVEARRSFARQSCVRLRRCRLLRHRPGRNKQDAEYQCRQDSVVNAVDRLDLNLPLVRKA